MAAHERGWKSAVHRQQWSSTLKMYAYPVVGAKPVAGICTDDVLSILRPLWGSRNSTSTKLRGRIELVLDFARASG